jgi:hypothetical protein
MLNIQIGFESGVPVYEQYRSTGEAAYRDGAAKAGVKMPA